MGCQICAGRLWKSAQAILVFCKFLQRFQLPLYCTNWFKFIMNWQICVGRRWTSAQSHARLRKFQRGFQRKAIFVCAFFCESSKCLNLCRLIKIDQGLTNLRRVMLEICATRYSSAIVFARDSDAHFCANLLTLTMQIDKSAQSDVRWHDFVRGCPMPNFVNKS